MTPTLEALAQLIAEAPIHGLHLSASDARRTAEAIIAAGWGSVREVEQGEAEALAKVITSTEWVYIDGLARAILAAGYALPQDASHTRTSGEQGQGKDISGTSGAGDETGDSAGSGANLGANRIMEKTEAEALAKAIYDALDENEFVGGFQTGQQYRKHSAEATGNRTTTLDGTFDLEALARAILQTGYALRAQVGEECAGIAVEAANMWDDMAGRNEAIVARLIAKQIREKTKG